MAEFNIFLGTARKSVGDVTLYRRSGKQVARVRVRDIANPKSEGQSETRNFLAPVIKFYAPLRKVLARSFEGLDKNRSYNEFQRTNIRMARANQWYLPKGTQFYPLPYQVSRGSLTPMQYSIQHNGNSPQPVWNVSGVVPDDTTIGRLSQRLINNGAKQGDIVTIIIIKGTDDGQFYPYSDQFYVNTADARNIGIIGGREFDFLVEETNVISIDCDWDWIYGLAIILTRPSGKNWLRSTQFLAVFDDITAQLVSAEQKALSIASYGPSSSEGGGVYPEPSGEPFNCQTISGRALLFYGGQYNAEVNTIGTYKVIKVKPANLDEYFYIKSAAGALLGTNSAGSLYPPDWRFVAASTAVATDDVTIRAAAGSPFATWLATIGFVV